MNAQGRLDVGAPVAIIDIGSNSVRLVVYEGLTRSPTPIFNEKSMAGLGRGVAVTGRLASDAMEKALAALRRFRVLCDTMRVEDITVVATAAARDAENGEAFIRECEAITRVPIRLISGRREAELSAMGVVSGIWKPDGIVGDLGGGSLELVDVRGAEIGDGISLKLGALALQDRSDGSLKKASKIIKQALGDWSGLKKLKGRTFYAVGGTWRSLARLHMKQRGYPLNVMHEYQIPASDAADFAQLVERVSAETLDSIEAVSAARRPLLGYGALLLEEIIRTGRPNAVVISASGVREGLLYERLEPEERAEDPLLSAAAELNVLRSRAPLHGEELRGWTDAFMVSAGLDETPEEKRLRHAACLLADIGWRAHPDYRGEQAANIVANAAFTGVDHPGRAFIALTLAYRHIGLSEDQISPRLRELITARMIDRARILGALMRVAYLVSAAMPGVLPRTPLRCEAGRVVLELPQELAALANERLMGRLKGLSRVIGRTAAFGFSKA